jgi:hypothetical protein
MRPVIHFGLSVGAICLFLTTGAKADPIATQGFIHTGVVTADGSDTGNINIATVFVIDGWQSSTTNSGSLAGMPVQTFGNITVNTNNPSSLTFNSPMFGTFTGTSITVALNVPMFLTLDVMGNWTPGTFGGVTGGPFASELALSFTQIPAGAGIIGVTGDFSTPPPGTVVPEPSAIFMVLPGLAAGFVSYRISRRRRGLVVS